MTGLIFFLVVVAGILGLLIGSFLNVVAYRVPAKVSLMRESRCPHCDAAIKPWHNVPVLGWIALRGKCANCKAPISARYPIVEAVTGIAFAVVTWWGLVAYEGLLGMNLSEYLLLPTVDGTVQPADVWAVGLVIAAFLYFAAISIVLTLIDLETHRLPNSIVLPSYLVSGLLFTVAAWLTGEWGLLLGAGVGMAVLYLFYFLLRAARPGGMGGGDVKLAGVIGIYLGWLGWGALAVGAFAAFLYGGVFGIALMLLRRAGRKTAIPFGPWMILGAWTGVFAGEAVGKWYVDLFVGA
ncbi:leader peptidase (prepilin peptidase)/N-methyltransferase [Microbacterium trichothecenolyticum]|uniref:prepilin peptidase n=1 Tax=Microbacterium trichothecenolyticum TaxID=69370 RepID=UPI002865D209|nr:prepilin peptidase [Microbacterium trichothecenolyticum]MDR7113312.1 leader peptidase (prepilin peptidase)/N-methyltransferase [Microbacterium trichothecenolyticum]